MQGGFGGRAVVVMQAWRSVVAALEAALDPEPVQALASGDPFDGAAPDSGVQVRPQSLIRLGRSNRSGPVLDLELHIGVRCRGERALDLLETIMVALEREAVHVEPIPESAGLGVSVRVPVAVPLTEPEAPLVDRARFDVGLVRPVVGKVVDAAGVGIADVLVRSAAGGAAAVSDRDGAFRVLAPVGGGTELDVVNGGEQRSLPVSGDAATATLVWE